MEFASAGVRRWSMISTCASRSQADSWITRFWCQRTKVSWTPAVTTSKFGELSIKASRKRQRGGLFLVEIIDLIEDQHKRPIVAGSEARQ